MKKIALLFAVCGLSLTAQDTTALRYSKLVTADGMKKNLYVLASDEYEGRETGQKGQKMAAEYIMKQFKEAGIPQNPELTLGYYQTFPVSVYQPQEVKLSSGAKQYIQNTDYYSSSTILQDSSYNLKEVVFAGYGINTMVYNDYDKLDVKGKTVMILNGEPFKDGKSIISSNTEASDWTTNYRRKYYEAQKAGVAILLVAETNLKEDFKKNEHRITSYRMDIDSDKKNGARGPLVVYISDELANIILNSKKNTFQKLAAKIASKGKPYNFTAKTNLVLDVKQQVSKLSTENVLAYVEGTDLKDELIVITGHYDHLGKHDGVVYNGADDDGSGTVAVIELAKAFAKAKKEGKGPRRSMLFMTVAGEEKGLLGSDYYTQHPVYPLKNTVANLNIDMIGRLDKAHADNSNYIYLIGSDKLSKDLHNISEEANKLYSNLQLDYTYNDENDPNRYYYRSDHYNFAKNNIPVIFYFNGVHEDYHKETDEVQKIDFIKMEKITRLVFFTAWDLANRTERIKLDKK
ncbi:MAG TPA: M28 family peptidase [Bacteroidia bacterium]